VNELGADPFIVPAMGSHGGATPRGQIKVLESLGITEESVGAPIISSMETVRIGELDDGTPVHMDKNAFASDGIIVVNRVKPHTDFKGKIESGLYKMMAIGLGKQRGAETIHGNFSRGYHELITAVGEFILKNSPIIMGIALVEDAHHKLSIIRALEPSEFKQEEKLLEIAKEMLARLPFKEIDVLVVEEIGKNISGVGMDTNITGRFWMPGEEDPRAPEIKRIVVLDLTEETHGNALGIGLADLTTRKVFSTIDYEEMYVNGLTQGTTEPSKIPPFRPNDRDAIATAIRISGVKEPEKVKLVRIKNTLDLEDIWLSEELLKVLNKSGPSDGIEVMGKLSEMRFDIVGNLVK
ncbi:MAG: DUF2088 domain-containing protein, partial [Candidatus Bathyarchaeia archaeon]